MTSVIVLADDGGFDVRGVIAALRQSHGMDVVTVTVDIGQSGDVRATRDIALAAGARRAHVFDAVDAFVRRCVLPALQSGVPVPVSRTAAAYPVIAAHLVDVARLEGASKVAHGGGEELSAAIARLDPSLEVVALGRSTRAIDDIAPRARARRARHLLQRPVSDPSVARGSAARVEIEFDEAIPVAINGVTLPLGELVESLSLIGGEHGIGHGDAANAPGALLLDTAYRALDRRSGTVRIELLDGHHHVLPASQPHAELVTHA